MKIGIVTLSHANDNYGGTLQAYATQTVLNELGHETFFVNTALCKRKFLFSRFIEHPVRECQRIRRYKAFYPFWKEHFRMDPQGLRCVEDVLKKPSLADALICGSDQIWSKGKCSDALNRRLVFLDFECAKNLRIAYAPSFGTSQIDDALVKQISPLLKRFSAVSVREKSGMAILDNCDVSSSWVVDPTLLLNKHHWSSLADKSAKQCPDNLMLYMGYRWKTKVSVRYAIKKISGQLGLKVQVPFSESPQSFMGMNIDLNPYDWIHYIRNSKFILTNSFHCMVFSIIFHKPFAILALGERHASMNARIESLGERLGLTDRIVYNQSNLEHCLENSIDWENVELKLEPWIKESRNFLEHALSNSLATMN